MGPNWNPHIAHVRLNNMDISGSYCSIHLLNISYYAVLFCDKYEYIFNKYYVRKRYFVFLEVIKLPFKLFILSQIHIQYTALNIGYSSV